jgi:hypothetical protein
MKSSGKQGANAAIVNHPCWLRGFVLVGDTATEPTLTLYDNASAASGTEVGFVMVSDENHTVDVFLPGKGCYCANGIYADLSAEEGDYIVYYNE